MYYLVPLLAVGAIELALGRLGAGQQKTAQVVPVVRPNSLVSVVCLCWDWVCLTYIPPTSPALYSVSQLLWGIG